jgi:hypothetical protein
MGILFETLLFEFGAEIVMGFSPFAYFLLSNLLILSYQDFRLPGPVLITGAAVISAAVQYPQRSNIAAIGT